MSKATATLTPARAEPEVLAAQVRNLLAPFFGGSDLGPAPVVADAPSNNPAPAARALVAA